MKDSGVAALESLVDRSQSNPFDYILLETTGVADPGNIAPMFWMDEGLGSSIYLDGIVTVVDAKNILKSLDEPLPSEIPESEPSSSSPSSKHTHSGPLLTTAHLQISHADVLILNKSDLVTSSDLTSIEQRLQSINSLALIHPTTHSRIDTLSGVLLDLHAYSTFPTTAPAPASFTAKGHSHHDPAISTLTIPLPPFDPQKLFMLDNYLQSVLWSQVETSTYEVHRTKGLILCTDGTRRVVQGVREIFEIIDVPTAPSRQQDDETAQEGDAPTEGKIVFIGKGLDQLPRGMGL